MRKLNYASIQIDTNLARIRELLIIFPSYTTLNCPFYKHNLETAKMATPAKRSRPDGKAKSFYAKQARKPQRNSIEVGDKGFLVTCNFKERDSVRECYSLLNSYYNKLHKAEEPEPEVKEEVDDDIESQLKDEIEKTNQELKARALKFQSIDTGVQNLIFIKTSIEDPLELGTTIIRDLAESKEKKTKVTLRFLPIQTVCKAKIEDIKNAAGELFDKHFLKEPSTFAINFNKRFNTDVQRDEVIKELADLVSLKNVGNKVNLKEPQVRINAVFVRFVVILQLFSKVKR